MKTIHLLKNTIQDYAWGSYTAIAQLLGYDSPSTDPQAELWMGAHPKAPSMVFWEGRWTSLSALIQKYPSEILGNSIAAKFGPRLPFLFKVLAAAKPLSIQAHPSRIQAEQGFERENRLEVPLNAAHRNYKDDNHKPECICALNNFWALNGFRKISEIIFLLQQVGPLGLDLELEKLQHQPNSSGLKFFFQSLLNLNPARRREVVDNAVSGAQKLWSADPVFEWMLKLHHEYPSDIGVLAPALLNLVMLEPEQAMYLPCGEPHAYLDGVGIEIMANSDNVLRGGLTSKHVDVAELLSILTFEEREIEILLKEAVNDCEKRYASAADEFALSVIRVDQNRSYTSPLRRGAEILLCTQGQATISDPANDTVDTLVKGNSVIVPAAVKVYFIQGHAVFYKALVPL